MINRLASGALLILLTCAGGAAQARDVVGFGTVEFPTSCSPAVQDRFETAVARLHAFDGPEQAFLAVTRDDPYCAIAWWGAAMAVRGNPLAGAPDAATLMAGRAHVEKALAAGSTTPREAGLIAAMGVYYRDPGEDHAARTRAYEAAMRELAKTAPDDAEIETFFALAILEAVDLTDKTYARQLEAGRILERIWARIPTHAGAPHYLIHAYDYPPLAARALDAARRYGGIAPGSVHAQHMPSHVYSMLGLWQDSIDANRSAAMLISSAGHHASSNLDAADPHGMDFIAYAHLQLGQDKAVADALAQAGVSEERTLVTARYLIERGDWAGAARMSLRSGSPLDSVTIRFVRALGAARSGRPALSRREIASLRRLRDPVMRSEGPYWAGLVDVYTAAAAAWADYAEGHRATALIAMAEAATLDDAREKHILLENKLVPVRELYGEILAADGRLGEALTAFRVALASAPNRLRSLAGAAAAAQASGNSIAAREYVTALLTMTANASPGRAEITSAKRLLGSRQ